MEKLYSAWTPKENKSQLKWSTKNNLKMTLTYKNILKAKNKLWWVSKANILWNFMLLKKMTIINISYVNTVMEETSPTFKAS